MTGYELRLWRKSFNWCQERAAEELGTSRRTYQSYEKTAVLPKLVILAITQIETKKLFKEFEHKSPESIVRILRPIIER